MFKAYKFRLYPNKEQQEYFAKCFGCTKLTLKKENENTIIVDVIFSRKELPIKIKVKRSVNFLNILDYLSESEWLKIMQSHFEKISKQSGLNLDFDEKCFRPLVNKLHTMVNWYEDKGWLDFSLFETNVNEWCFVKEYFGLDWLEGRINLPEVNFDISGRREGQIIGYKDNGGWSGTKEPIYSREGW